MEKNGFEHLEPCSVINSRDQKLAEHILNQYVNYNWLLARLQLIGSVTTLGSR